MYNAVAAFDHYSAFFTFELCAVLKGREVFLSDEGSWEGQS